MGTVFHSVWSDFGDFSMRFFNAGPCANPGAPLARTEALLLRLHCNASPTRSPPSIATQHLPPRGTNYCCFSGAFRVCGESEALLFEASRTQAPLKRNSSPPPIRGRWREAPEGALCEPRRCCCVFIATPRQLAAPLLSLRDIFPQGGTNYCCFSGAFRVCGESEALLFEASRTQAPLKRNSSPPPIRGRWREAPEGALREPRRRSSATVVLPRFGGGGAKRRRGRCANRGVAGTSSLQRLANSQPPFCRYATSSPKGGRITVASAGRFGFAERARPCFSKHREPRRRSSATVVLPRFGGGGAKRRRGPCANPGAAQAQQ